MTIGLKKHTHADRERIVRDLVPLVRKHQGANLIALAATGSFARNADGEYSDVELIGFVRRPEGDKSSIQFVHDGMVIDLWFLTKEEYLKTFKLNVRAIWPYLGDNVLMPLLNEPFISKLQDIPSQATPEACHATLRAIWPQVQEATAKVLTAVGSGNHEPTPLLFQLMAREMCVALALLNARAFTTRSAVLTEARQFELVPAHFDLLVLSADGPREPGELKRRALIVFGEIEALIQSVGLQLYDTDLGAFVRPRSAMRRTCERWKIDRLAIKLAGPFRRFGGRRSESLNASEKPT